jgi:hypothetical protein
MPILSYFEEVFPMKNVLKENIVLKDLCFSPEFLLKDATFCCDSESCIKICLTPQMRLVRLKKFENSENNVSSLQLFVVRQTPNLLSHSFEKFQSYHITNPKLGQAGKYELCVFS